MASYISTFDLYYMLVTSAFEHPFNRPKRQTVHLVALSSHGFGRHEHDGDCANENTSTCQI